jgi:transposase InsO family protein
LCTKAGQHQLKKFHKFSNRIGAYRDEITIENGILMKGKRILIPTTLQVEILGKLHAAHQGEEKTKLRARTSIRLLAKDERRYRQNNQICRTCQEFQPTQTRQALIPTEVPPRPWHTIATDLFYLDNTEYLLVSDYYSKYPFVSKIPKGQSNSKTNKATLKQIFSEQGIPEVVRSDGPHYSSKDYREFSNEYRFKIVTSSPHYPRRNGYIESQMKTVKAILAKAKNSETDPNIALLCLRSTPIDNYHRYHHQQNCS